MRPEELVRRADEHVRVGFIHYNTAAEVDRLLDVLTELADQP